MKGHRPVTAHDPGSASDLLGRLEAGASPGQVCQALGLAAGAYATALAGAVLGPDDPAVWPALVQESPRRPWLAAALGEEALAELFPRAARTARLALAAGLLQIHDFWDASHQAAQQADDLGERSFSAYWHGIAHRREPDAGNAGYWFRRVGRHPLFSRLAADAQPLLGAHGDGALTGSILAGGSWNPMAMIDLCTTTRAGSARALLALKLQRLEMLALLDATVGAL
jgi:hypothetical protein